MNQHDSSVVAEILLQNGYDETGTPERADLILLNTCSVREHAETRAIGRANNLAYLKGRNPGLVIGIIGCVAQARGVKLIQEVPCVDFVLGPDCYRDLPGVIQHVRESQGSIVLTEFRQTENYGEIKPKPTGISSFVPIMRGCNNFCSYCVVPYTRGRERSWPSGEIIEEIERLARSGVKEITLIGQNVNSYSDGVLSFADLLRAVDKIADNVRVRFTTSHPRDFGDDLVSAMADCRSLCEHIHLPLQSGSSRVLKLMNRGYTAEEYLEKVELARTKIRGLAITTDLLVGFPGEDDADFRETLDLARKIGFDFAYMFAYSPRDNTKAASLEGQGPCEVRQERLRELIAIQNSITQEKNRSLVSSTVELLVWGRSKDSSEEHTGKTRTNKDVVFRGEAKIGDYVNVNVEELRGWTPYGRKA
jgi:tRNA-2-methylthio-N6-dimethylallyladenosine synthase